MGLVTMRPRELERLALMRRIAERRMTQRIAEHVIAPRARHYRRPGLAQVVRLAHLDACHPRLSALDVFVTVSGHDTPLRTRSPIVGRHSALPTTAASRRSCAARPKLPPAWAWAFVSDLAATLSLVFPCRAQRAPDRAGMRGSEGSGEDRGAAARPGLAPVRRRLAPARRELGHREAAERAGFEPAVEFPLLP